MKTLVTPRSFGKTDPDAFQILLDAGFEIVRNPRSQVLTESELQEYLAGCDGIIVGIDPLTRPVLAAADRLKAIAKYGVGLDNIDLDYCREKISPYPEQSAPMPML
jgi:phosphoglycerate dehydrogenase-like enzyme